MEYSIINFVAEHLVISSLHTRTTLLEAADHGSLAAGRTNVQRPLISVTRVDQASDQPYRMIRSSYAVVGARRALAQNAVFLFLATSASVHREMCTRSHAAVPIIDRSHAFSAALTYSRSARSPRSATFLRNQSGGA